MLIRTWNDPSPFRKTNIIHTICIKLQHKHSTHGGLAVKRLLQKKCHLPAVVWIPLRAWYWLLLFINNLLYGPPTHRCRVMVIHSFRDIEKRLFENCLQEIQAQNRRQKPSSTHMSKTGRIVYLQRSHRKFVIVMCIMIEIQDFEGVQKNVLFRRTNFKKNEIKFISGTIQ